ncbi:MAG: lamin tail domain-containing protein [Verrucomicrobiae bacterium]|nr:lamin tail domain-containing protein [Verrucomicrobiae bacterium]
MKFFRAPATAAVVVGMVLGYAVTAHGQTTNGVLREVFRGISTGTISALTSAPNYPNNPDLEEVLTQFFECPREFSDYYGTRLRALLIPPVTGTYYFYIASDDQGQLFLSSDENPANKQLIASVNSWTAAREYNKEPNQRSAGIVLTNGRRYYIEALQAEGAGGDNLAVAWQMPGQQPLQNNADPIPAIYAVPYGLGPPTITTQPQNISVVEGGSGSFSVALARYIGATFQWYKNGLPVAGGTNAMLTVGPVALSDNGATFRCAITNAYGGTNSLVATLTVTADITPPVFQSGAWLGHPQVLSLLFSEPLEAASATNPANYSIASGFQVLGAGFGPDTRTVVLYTTPLTNVTSVTVTVNNVRDRATTPNTIPANSTRTISLSVTPLDSALRWPAREPAGPATRNGPLVISEIMYNPTNRSDGRDLEFLEIYNAQLWPEEIGGFRITGAVEYTFPTGTVIQANSRLVVAAVPADVQAVYGISGVLGPFSGRLQNEGGTLRLRNHLGAVLFEVEYSDDWPWPAAADGGGHSLVLARPSYGANDPRAWAASERLGGSPGTDEPVMVNLYRAIMFNEVMPYPGQGEQPFLELFNYAAGGLNLSGCILTDETGTNRYVFPANTVIPGMGFLAISQSQLGWSLNPEGGKLFLRDPSQIRVIDAVKYPGVEAGRSWGRSPDGGIEFSHLTTPTAGRANAAPLTPEVVIHEIMFDPITENADDEFIELHNPGSQPVNLSKWRIRGDVSYTFPNPTVIQPGGFLVIGANTSYLRTRYPNLNAQNSVGDYQGRLANRGGWLRLEKPVQLFYTNQNAQVAEAKYEVVVHQARFQAGGRWPAWTGGGGSSQELVDPRVNGLWAMAWRGSDESGQSDWVVIQHTGVLDNGMDTADSLQVLLLGPGECLVDDVEVIPAGGTNLVLNGSFNQDASGWFFQGTHCRSSWEPLQGYGGPGCLYVRASSRGDTGANRIRTRLARTLNAGETATIRARVKWLKGHPEILLRLRGNYLEATGNMLSKSNFGTPGRASRPLGNGAPVIMDVTHSPVLPTAGQTVRVIARVFDPDGLSALFVRYRVDPATNWNSVAMSYHGAGYYSASIPAQSSGAVAAFYILAADLYGLTRQFPEDAPERECLIRWGESTPSGQLGVYRMWLTQKTINQWTTREKLSNDPLDGTFVYGNSRVIYNAGNQYSGSPWHSPGFNSPLSGFCDFALSFPPDEPLLGSEELTLQWPGNGGGDGTAQGEQHAYWLAYQLGLPYCYRRPVHFYVNGNRRGDPTIEDVQQPNREFVQTWYPDQPRGDLHKIQIWFEFDDQASTFAAAGANLGNYTTTGGQKKLAVYRWTWSKRAYGNQGNNYTNLFRLVDAANTSASGENYTRAIEAVIDVNQWARHFLVEKLVGNWDSYGNGGGQNMYTYMPQGGTWKMLIWDIDFAFYSGSPTDGLFGFTDGPLSRLFSHPPFARAYWRAIKDAAEGPLQPSRSNTILDYRYNALRANGISLSAPDNIKNYISGRLQYLQNTVLPQIASPFQVTSLPGGNWTTNRNLLTLSGTAPIEVESITINGIPVPVVWTTVTNWTASWALQPGTQTLTVAALNGRGQTLSTTTRTVTYTGTPESPSDVLVINEIMYQPPWPGAEYVEIYNRSQNNAFDLSNWRLHGVDYQFPLGTIIQPNGYLVVAKSIAAFNTAYGASPAVIGEFGGNLDKDGEVIRLEKPASDTNLLEVVDEVYYETMPPWPVVGAQEGASLQLRDAAQDNSRAANWTALTTNLAAPPAWRFISASGVAGSGVIYVYLQTAGDCYIDDLKLVAGSNPDSGANLLVNGDFESPLAGTWNVSANHAGSYIDTAVKRSGNSSLHLMASSGGTTRDSSIWQDASSRLTQGQTYTLSFWYLPGASGGPLTIRFSGSWIRIDANLGAAQVQRATPGAPNSVATSLPAFPSLWLNEVQPLNVSGLRDRFNEAEPWVELFNSGTNTVSLSGFYLASQFTNLAQWAFPTNASIGPRQFLTVWLDGEPGETSSNELHASFRLTSPTGSVALARLVGGQTSLVHHLNFRVPGPDRSYGLYPDGRAARRQIFALPTPGATNNPAYPPVSVFINEWMADNVSALADPADGNFEDWFELFNAGNTTADLSGYYLSDDLANAFKWRIPQGTLMPPRSYLLVWADGEPEQNSGGDLHANFRLSASGESIGLYGPDGTLVDLVVFGPQAPDRSEGRFPDGAEYIGPMNIATPRTPNRLNFTNSPPALAPLPNQVVAEGTLLTFSFQASDPDAGQNLVFTLEPGAPPGASVTPEGTFSWLPTEEQGGQTYTFTVRVRDNGTPPLSVTQSFSVTVEKVNSAPQLLISGDFVIYEGEHFALLARATDGDLPRQSLRFSLGGEPPLGAQINPTNGLLTWTPSEIQGPGLYALTVRVIDDGQPPLMDSQIIRITVLESNTPPRFPQLGPFAVAAQQNLNLALNASDDDWPAQYLTYAFAQTPPSGATLTPDGRFNWTPTLSHTGQTFTIHVQVTDDGIPPASATTAFTVVVHGQNTAPVLAAAASNLVAITGEELRVTNVAWDAEAPPQILRWQMLAGPTNASLEELTGTWRWRPQNLDAGTTQSVQLVVTDNGLPPLSATQSFAVIVLPAAAAPPLTAVTRSVLEREPLEFLAGPLTNTLGQALNYVIVRAPRFGTATILPDQRVRYLSGGFFNGMDTFEIGYLVNGILVRTAPVTVTVGIVNDVAPYLFEFPLNYRAGAQPVAVVTGDFNRDSKLDAACANAAGNSISLLFGNGQGGLAAPVELPIGGVVTHLATGDFNRDSRLDLVVAGGRDNRISLLIGGGDGTFASPFHVPSGSNVTAVAVTDLDKDGKPDVLCTHFDDNTLGIHFGNGVGWIRNSTSIPVGTQPLALLADDFNADTRPDIAVAEYGQGTIRILLGAGNGGFLSQHTYITGTGPRAMAAGDFNGDGRRDLAVAHSDGLLVVLRNVGLGLFAATNQVWLGGSPAGLLAADINRDGLLDLVVSDEADSSLKVLLGLGDGTFQNYYQDQGAFYWLQGLPGGLALGDFNKDTFADVVVAQWGSDEVAVLLNNYQPRVLPMKLTTLEDWPLEIRLRGSTGPLQFQFGSGPTNGTLTLKRAPDVYWYRPHTNANGRDVIEYFAFDGQRYSAPAKIAVTILPVNDPPEISLATNVVVAPEDSGYFTVPGFITRAVGGPASALDEQRQAVRFQLTAAQPTLFAAQPAIISGGALRFMPAKNQFGETLVTLVGRDNGPVANGGQNLSAPVQFLIRVENVNDPPVLGYLPGKTGYEDQEIRWDFTVSDLESPPDSLTFSFASTNEVLLPPTALRVEGAGTNRVLVARPATNEFGRTLITLTVSDGTNSASRSFSLLVYGVNDPPVIALLTNRVVLNAEPTTQSIPVINWAGCFNGPENESAQTLRFVVVSPRKDLFRLQPAISPQGVLSCQPAATVGTVEVLVYGVDSGGVSYGGQNTSEPVALTIEVRP